MKTKKRSHVIVAVAAVAVGAASLTAGGAGAAAGAPAAPNKAPLTFFQTVPIDNPVLSWPTFRTGSAVAAAAINSAGGIAGHPVKILFCDNKNIASVSAQCAEQAVAAGAVAQTASQNPQAASSNPIIKAANMANFGTGAVIGDDFTGPNQYPLGVGSYAYLGYGQITKKKWPQARTVSIMIADTAGYQTRLALLVRGAQAAGLQILDQVVVPNTTADMSPIAGQFSRSKPDVVWGPVASPQQLKYWSAAQSLGMTIPELTQATALTPDVLAQAGSAAAWTFGVDWYPNPNGNAEGASLFRAQMKKYAPGQPITRDAWMAWVGVTSLAAIMQSMKDPITPATVWGTISRVKCFNTLYFRCLNFTKPGPIPEAPALRVTNLFLVAIQNGQLASTPITANIS